MNDPNGIINVVIIGAGAGGTSILKALLKMDKVNILGIADVNPEAPGIQLAKEKGITTSLDFSTLLHDKRVGVIIEATGVPEVQERIRKEKLPQASFMESAAAYLMIYLIDKHEEMVKVKELEEHIGTILNSAQEGIQVVNNSGKVIYVNDSFCRITKLIREERLGQNIFDVSPKGALAEVLRTKEPVFGKVNIIKGKQIEVLSNASPVMVEGEMRGAVVVFRDISDIRRMAQKLEESKEVINYLKEEINNLVAPKYSFADLIGNNERFLKCIKIARQAADNLSTVLITGESGTGKELFAHAIHKEGSRADGPFIKVNCAAIPETLLESELFGYEKGAFTGATKAKMGKFELANGGTIFLDEIGDMNIVLQAKLLRVLQEKEVERLGSNRPQKIDVRIVAATNQNLLKHVEQGLFRRDLYYRLNVINVDIPPLRDRKDDVLLLAQHIIQKLNKRHGKECVLSQKGLTLLARYDWPGNVRELENLLERAVILSEGKVISIELVQSYFSASSLHETEEILSLAEMEKRLIKKALDVYGRDLAGKKEAAKKLKISLATLYNKLSKYKMT